MRSQLADVAHHISEERQDRYYRSRAIRSKPKDNNVPLISADDFTLRNKEADLVREAIRTKSKPESKQYKGRHTCNGSRNGYFGW
jgi:hypothetical protein